MKLISMTYFVENIKGEVTKAKEARQKCLSSSYLTDIFNYANFLKQPLTLAMLIPVDEEGNVYIDYKEFGGIQGTVCVPYEGLFEVKKRGGSGVRLLNGRQEHPEDERFYDSNKYDDALIEYNKAKSKALFEGFTSPDNFKVHKGNDFDYYLIKFPIEHYRCSDAEYDNINGTIININCDVEGIIGVTLTETAIKMIYGN